MDAFNYTDHYLNSVLGRYDGNVYPKLYEEAWKDPLNDSVVPDGYQEYIRPLIKQQLRTARLWRVCFIHSSSLSSILLSWNKFAGFKTSDILLFICSNVMADICGGVLVLFSNYILNISYVWLLKVLIINTWIQRVPRLLFRRSRIYRRVRINDERIVSFYFDAERHLLTILWDNKGWIVVNFYEYPTSVHQILS